MSARVESGFYWWCPDCRTVHGHYASAEYAQERAYAHDQECRGVTDGGAE